MISRAALLYLAARDDRHALDEHLRQRPIPRRGLGRCDFFEHLVAFDQLAESRVLSVEETRIAVADEELAARRIRILRTRHAEHAAHMLLGVELRLDLVARIARAPARLVRVVLRERVAALDHEVLDHAMET